MPEIQFGENTIHGPVLTMPPNVFKLLTQSSLHKAFPHNLLQLASSLSRFRRYCAEQFGRQQFPRSRPNRLAQRKTIATHETLENRLALSGSDYEQYFIYELNRARHDPAAYQAASGAEAPLGSVIPRPPLAINPDLVAAAGYKSNDMASRNYFNHTAPGDPPETPNELVRRFGYDLLDVVQIGTNTYVLHEIGNQVESLSGGTTTADAALKGLIESPEHRNHLLGITAHNQIAREVGLGYAYDESSYYKHYWTVLAAPSKEPLSFLTGVVFADGDSDERFDVSEGIGGVTITATGPNGNFTTSSMAAGGWTLKVPEGEYVVSASGGGFSGTSSVALTVAAENVAVDFVSGASEGWINFERFTNSAPTLDLSNTKTLPPVLLGTVSPFGVPAGDLLLNDVADTNPLAMQGVAIIGMGATTTSGAWSYSVDSGISWLPLNAPSTENSLLLRATDLIRFTPSSTALPGNASLRFRAWDQTAGLAGGTADTSLNGGSTAFSATEATASIATVAENNAPFFTQAGGGILDSVPEDVVNPRGTLVSEIVGSIVADSDPGTPPAIAIIDYSGSDAGKWEYSIDNAVSWQSLGELSDASALLLQSSTRVRFDPAPDFNGTASFSYRAWDQSSGRAGTTVDLSNPQAVGGASAFSSETRTATISVTAINDAPLYIPGRSTLRLKPVPEDHSFNFTGTTVADLLGNAVFDIDEGSKQGIALIELGAGCQWYWNTGGSNWGYATVAPQWARLLQSTDIIGISPNAGFTGDATFAFRLWDQSTIETGSADLSNPGKSTGGETAFGSEILTARIFVGSAGEAPTVTIGSPTRSADGDQVVSVPITFSRPVEGFDLGDLTLARGDSVLSISDAILTGSGSSFVLAGLGELTNAAGGYTLTLPAAFSGITDSTGNRLFTGATTSFTVNSEDVPPNGVALSPSSIAEGQPLNTVVGTLTTESFRGISLTYTLSPGVGDINNGSFEIVGDELRSREVFDYERKSQYAIRVRATDEKGLFTEQNFIVSIEPPPAAPTIDPIADLRVPEDAEEQNVTLAGVTAGENESQHLKVTATSDNTLLIPHPVIVYSSPSTSGNLELNVLPNQHGTSTITVTVEDGGRDNDLNTTSDNLFVNQSFRVTVDPAADAPSLDTSASPRINVFPGNAAAPTGRAGTLVSSLIAKDGPLSNFSDDDGDLPGLAITGVNLQGGRLWYTTDDGNFWSEVGAVSDTHPLPLAANTITRVYFEPPGNLDRNIVDAISFRAWDRNLPDLSKPSGGWTRIGSDIDGEAPHDNSGSALALSSNGRIVAIGAFKNDGNGTDSGHVRVYEYGNGQWSQLGNDIDGEASGDQSGNSVAISSDGRIVAIGAFTHDVKYVDEGHVRVFQYDSTNSTWAQLGTAIEGEELYGRSGKSISLSADGLTVAIGSGYIDASGAADSGQVRIYRYNSLTDAWVQLGLNINGESSSGKFGHSLALSSDGQTVAIGAYGNSPGTVGVYRFNTSLERWDQLGAKIEGEASWDYAGQAVAMSSDGEIVAVGAVGNDGNGDRSGHVRVYRYSSTDEAWSQVGSDIDGEASLDESGVSVSLSSDGQTVAIGAKGNDGSGSNSGHARIYQFDSADSDWAQLGDDIDGEASGDFSGTVALASDGRSIAVGAERNGFEAGHVRIYDFVDSVPETVAQNSLSTLSDTVSINLLELIPESGSPSLARDSDEKLFAATAPITLDGQQVGTSINGFAAFAAESSDGINAVLVRRADVEYRLITNDAWKIFGFFGSLRNRPQRTLNMESRGIAHIAPISVVAGAFDVA